MIKIIHLSDIHCGTEERVKKFKHLADKIIENFNPEECVVCITGDLIDCVYDDLCYKKPGKIIEKLQQKKYQVLLVPGNHDYGSGSKLGKNVSEKVLNFKKVFFSKQNHKPKWDKDTFYPKIDFAGEGNEKIAFIGLDSNEGELKGWFKRKGADGRFGKKQRNRFEYILYNNQSVRNCRYRVIYFHHHANKCRLLPVIEEFHELQDRKKFGKLIKKYQKDNPYHPIDALLYGHEHWFKNNEEGLWGVHLCYDAGSSTRKKKKGLPLSKVRIIDLSGKTEIVDWLKDYQS